MLVQRYFFGGGDDNASIATTQVIQDVLAPGLGQLQHGVDDAVVTGDEGYIQKDVRFHDGMVVEVVNQVFEQ
jgi:hypothetical protein